MKTIQGLTWWLNELEAEALPTTVAFTETFPQITNLRDLDILFSSHKTRILTRPSTFMNHPFGV